MMNPKMIKILRKGNDREFLKLNEVRKETARINARLKPYQLDRPVKTARDVYTLSILEEGLKNKQKIEELYEQTRTEMLDIWEIIDYPKRNEFRTAENSGRDRGHEEIYGRGQARDDSVLSIR